VRKQREAVIDLQGTDDNRDGNDSSDNDDDSEKMPLQDNGAVGRDNAKKGQMAFQVMEGVELPIFREICPRWYLYRYDLKL
jgi:hypothetical protein